MDDKGTEKEMYDVSEKCDICTKSGFPKPSKKMSITHVNEAFNQECQIDYELFTVKGQNLTGLTLTDTGTAYTETCIVERRDMSTAGKVIQNDWIYRHGNPKAITGGDEFNNKPFEIFLKQWDIQFKPRPPRRTNKLE